MTKRGNIIKSNDDSADYFPKVHKKHGGTDLFDRQQIPYDEKLLGYGAFETFVASRAKQLAKAINEFMSSLKT